MSSPLRLLAPSLSLLLLSAACQVTPDPNPSLSPSELVGEWSVEQIGDASVLEPGRAYLAFGDDGRLTGSTGVNRISGSWDLTAGGLSFSELVTTRRAGTPEAMEQEQRLLAALGRVGGAELGADGRLVLVAADGAELVRGARRAAAAEGGARATVSGAAFYRERMLLGPGHILVVELQDVSRADAPATVLGRTESAVSGSGPMDFEVSYDPADVQERRRYVLRATLRDAAGELVFLTTQAYPVLTEDSPSEGIQLLLQRAP